MKKFNNHKTLRQQIQVHNNVIEQAIEGLPKEKVIPKTINMQSYFYDVIKAFLVKDQGFNEAISEFRQSLEKLKIKE